MNTQKLIVMVGLPASGKSTWALNWVKEDPEYRLRVNRDSLRGMFTVGYRRDIDRYIKRIERTIVEQLLMDGMSVVVDDTNLKAEDILEWDEMVDWVENNHPEGTRYIELEYHRMDTPKEECIRRNAERTANRVPNDAIEVMSHSKYLTIDSNKILEQAILECHGTVE